jgi:hypothetical protein
MWVLLRLDDARDLSIESLLVPVLERMQMTSEYRV